MLVLYCRGSRNKISASTKLSGRSNRAERALHNGHHLFLSDPSALDARLAAPGKMGLAEAFAEAAERVKKLDSASNDDQLELYGNFKQSNVGDCNTSRPGMFSPKERAKWDAWNGVKGSSKDDAMKAYIAKVDSLCGTSFESKI